MKNLPPFLTIFHHNWFFSGLPLHAFEILTKCYHLTLFGCTLIMSFMFIFCMSDIEVRLNLFSLCAILPKNVIFSSHKSIVVGRRYSAKIKTLIVVLVNIFFRRDMPLSPIIFLPLFQTRYNQVLRKVSYFWRRISNFFHTLKKTRTLLLLFSQNLI